MRDPSVTGPLKEYLRAQGADLVGIGPVDRLRGAPEIMQPTRYLDDGASFLAKMLRMALLPILHGFSTSTFVTVAAC